MPARRQKLWALLWLLVLAGCAALGAQQLLRGADFDTRITALLPESAQSPQIERANRQLGAPFTDRFVMLLDAPDRGAATAALARALEASGTVEALRYRPEDFNPEGVRAQLGPLRYRLLTPALREAIDAGETQGLRQAALSGLVMPTALDQHPLRDPFALLDRWISERFSSRVDTGGEYLSLEVEGRPLVVVTGRLAGSAFAPGLQQKLLAALDDFRKAQPEARLWRSGMVFHAADGARQASREINTIGLGSLAGVLLILLLAFRSPRTIATLLMPLAVGGIFAFSLTLAIFGGVHLLTVAFGSSLIGVAIDYALHLQCARAAGGARFRLRTLLPGLSLGLVTSLMAYVVQAFTPMPGLRQMAIFAGLGLVGAWLTVVLWMPLIPLRAHPATERLALRLWHIMAALRGRLGPRSVLLLMLAALALAALRLESDDSLRLINTSPARLLEDEQLIQRELGRDTGSLYLLVSAESEAAFLERAESLAPQLEALVQNGHLGGYSSLARHVPSRARQIDNLERTERLYQRELPELYEAAGLPATLYPRALETLEAVPFLTLDTWLESPLGESDRRLWLGEDDAGRFAGMITLGGQVDDTARARLSAQTRGDAHLTFVDRAADISTVLGELRQQIALWVAGALALVGLLLSLRYRRHTWRVTTPAFGAILTVLTVYALAGVPINLFHQLALLLVLGIGLDAGIFLQESPKAHHAWLAITLSIVSSLLAFGLLAFSATPVLHHLGLTALIGLAAVWVLSALVHREPADTERRHQESAHV